MAIQNITYGDKTDLNTTSVANINKVSASDLNEIKSVVNNNGTEVSNLQNYSTNEVVIGKWTDDKPIYRKVISNISVSSGNEFWVNINASVDTFVNISAFGRDANASIFEPIPSINTSDSSYNNGLRAYNSQDSSHANQIRITKGSGSIISTAFLIIEYTKTTD